MPIGNDPTELIDFAIAKERSGEDVVGKTGTQTSAPRGSNWANWTGAIFYCAFALWILTSASQFSVWLLPAILHEFFVGVCFLIRSAPKRRYNVWYARASAYIATFAFPVFTSVAGLWHRDWMALSTNRTLVSLATGLWVFGTIIGFWALWPLRRSFSLEPQARELVTTGPYTIARHPIYLSHILLYAAIVLSHPTFTLVCLYCLWFVVMFIRARFEERVLSSAFQDYEAFRGRTWMFCPNLFRLAASRRSDHVADVEANRQIG
jgi:protein-S-isoprenylcysteine O-methyltransferase Ste14